MFYTAFPTCEPFFAPSGAQFQIFRGVFWAIIGQSLTETYQVASSLKYEKEA